jgi:predicted protein tyrosine phosphatase
MHALHKVIALGPVVAGKGAGCMYRRLAGSRAAHSPTRRETQVSSLCQAWQWACGATDIWFKPEPFGAELVSEKSPHCSFISIGSLNNAFDADVLDRYHGVINCCGAGECPAAYFASSHPKYVQVQMDDVNSVETAAADWDAAYALACDAADAGDTTVLIHCSMGASRSVAVAIYILGRYSLRYDYDHWLRVIQLQRPYVNPSLALRRTVVDLWKSLESKDASASAGATVENVCDFLADPSAHPSPSPSPAPAMATEKPRPPAPPPRQDLPKTHTN